MTFSLFKTVFFIVIVSAIAYGFWEGRTLMEGPGLSLISPAQGAVTGNGFVTVSGNVARINALSVNGLAILPNEDGSFKRVFVFARGEDILQVTVTDRFGRSVTKTRDIISK
ncbi:MAG TPA: hypothetical protein ENI56_00040 [Candidatus Kaiserbacteria bacterium]|nr:hypothetical protein [Candidatus Kaiserbacteria bacterium]